MDLSALINVRFLGVEGVVFYSLMGRGETVWQAGGCAHGITFPQSGNSQPSLK